MTGLYEQSPGQGHNRPPVEDKEGKWERWSKKRTFVRELAGTYSDVYKSLLEQPRVYSSRNHPWKGGPALYGKHVVSPQAAKVIALGESILVLCIPCKGPIIDREHQPAGGGQWLRLDFSLHRCGPTLGFRKFGIVGENFLERLRQSAGLLDGTLQKPARRCHQDELGAAQPAAAFARQ